MYIFSFHNYYSHSAAWFYFNKPGYIVMSLALDEYSALDNFYLNPGWNFIHVVPTMEGESFETMAGDCNIQKVAFWNNREQDWSVMTGGANDWVKPIPRDSIGTSIVIKVEDSCKLASSISGGNGGTGGPPALPN